MRIEDQNRNVITHSFDPLNRLVERRIEQPNGGGQQVERFHYDGLNRIVVAVTKGVTVTRRYDSLSRLLEENQAGRTIRYDNAGNRTHIAYPGGQKVLKVYDPLKRVSEVRNSGNVLIAQYAYRSSGQLLIQKLGNVLEATFAYKQCQGCLSEVVYHSQKDRRLIDGSRYSYDDASNRIQEVQLHRGDTFGERYFYDSINRLVGVQYGVQDLNNAKSAFEQEVQYDLSPAGNWRNKRCPETTWATWED